MNDWERMMLRDPLHGVVVAIAIAATKPETRRDWWLARRYFLANWTPQATRSYC